MKTWQPESPMTSLQVKRDKNRIRQEKKWESGPGVVDITGDPSCTDPELTWRFCRVQLCAHDFTGPPRQLDPEAPQAQSWKAGTPLGSSWDPAVPSCQSWDPEDRRTGRDSKTRHCIKSMQWFTAGLKMNFQESIKHFWVSSDQNDFVLFQKCPLRQSCRLESRKVERFKKYIQRSQKIFVSTFNVRSSGGDDVT